MKTISGSEAVDIPAPVLPLFFSNLAMIKSICIACKSIARLAGGLVIFLLRK
jgi:hypothetical protein